MKKLHLHFPRVRAACCMLLLMWMAVGCSHAASSTACASSDSVLPDQAAYALAPLRSADYWEDDAAQHTSAGLVDISALTVADRRAGQSAPYLTEFDTASAGDGLQVIALGGVESCNFYVYTCYDPAQNAFQGLIVDYGDTQHLYDFPEVPYPSADLPEFYLSNDGKYIYMVYSAASGTGISAGNLCVFQLQSANVSLYLADFRAVADDLAAHLSVSYDPAARKGAVTVDSASPYSFSVGAQNNAGKQAQPAYYYCGSQLGYAFRDGSLYIIAAPEFLDSEGVSFPPQQRNPMVTAKINILTDSAGHISGVDFSEASCAGTR